MKMFRALRAVSTEMSPKLSEEPPEIRQFFQWDRVAQMLQMHEDQQVEADGERTVNCAFCHKELARAEAKKCGMCKERRTPNAAYYCDKKCQKPHWRAEHKSWHERVGR